MTLSRERLEEGLLTLGIGLSVLISGWFWPGSLVARTLLVFGLAFGAYTIGARLDRSGKVLWNIGMGLVSLVALQSLLQTILYYLSFSLDGRTDAVALALSLLLLQSATLFMTDPTPPAPDAAERLPIAWTVCLIVAGGSAAVFAGLSLWASGTTESIRTPWPLLMQGTLLCLTGLGGLAWLAGLRLRRHWLPAVFLAHGLGLVAALAPLVYQLGFGFDGFLHRASEQVLLTTGTLSPKPPYYIGLYVLVTWLARLLSTSVQAIDPWIAPALLAALPFFVLRAFPTDRRGWMVGGLMASLPLAGLVGGTPQTVAYLLGTAALALAVATRERSVHWILPCLLALWSLAVHPLAGLPLAGVTIAVLLLIAAELDHWPRLAASLAGLATIGAIISVPVAFFVNSQRSSATITWHWASVFDTAGLTRLVTDLGRVPMNHVALWADLAQWVGYAFPVFLFVLTLVAMVKDWERRRVWSLLFFAAIGTALAGCFLRLTGDFTFLIDYERGNFADRLFLIAELLLVLPALAGLGMYTQRLSRSRSTVALVSFFVFLLAWQAALIYRSYPIHDAAVVGRGWSVGQSDVDAVRFIDQDAQGKTYTVLANQSVSAAAVSVFGFKRYVDDVFYYPIPTGGPLYEIFLRAAGAEANRETINEAAKLGQSELVYVVVNNYWWDAERVNDQLSSIAEKVQPFGDGKVTVYRFEVK